MSALLTVAGLLGLLAVFFGGLVWIVKNDKRVPVVGIDVARGYVERRKLKPNKHGGLTWVGRDGRKAHIVTDSKFAYKGKSGVEFLVDVSEGMGTVISLGAGKMKSLDGFRLYEALFGGGLKDIAASSRNDINKTLTILLVGGGVGLLMILGAVIYAINLLQKANAATGGAGGAVVGVA